MSPLNLTPLELVVLGLATWRISHALAFEEGPFGVLSSLRRATGVSDDGMSWPAWNPIPCSWCNSVWLGFGVILVRWIAPIPTFWVASVFALSAVVCLIEVWCNGKS